MDPAERDPVLQEPRELRQHHPRRRQLEVILLSICLVATVIGSILFVWEMKWRWRRFVADWS